MVVYFKENYYLKFSQLGMDLISHRQDIEVFKIENYLTKLCYQCIADHSHVLIRFNVINDLFYFIAFMVQGSSNKTANILIPGMNILACLIISAIFRSQDLLMNVFLWNI